eukprot:1590524-Rhodomonas_salina.1
MATAKRAKNSPNWAPVLLETDLGEVDEEDDLLNAFGAEELHLDYAHAITLGYNKERYYLFFVVGGRNFMWASPSLTRKEPEELLREFLAVTRVKIGKLRTDNEFTASSTFQAFCKKRDITMAPAVAYTHTMQARAEGA